jgi:uncharacterized damage-inducible protein DinB
MNVRSKVVTISHHSKQMNPILASKYGRLAKEYERLKDMIYPYQNDVLNENPAEGKWSALQIMTHLQQSEQLSLQYLRKKMQDETLRPTGFREAFRTKLLEWVFKTPMKFKAPAAVRINIPEFVEKSSLIATYDQTRSELEEFLSSFPEKKIPLAIYKHPRIGYINMSQTLDFLIAHFNHHTKQVHTILTNKK